MTTRIERFESYKSHPWLKKIFAKLSDEEIEIARSFIKENLALDRGSFEMKVNRMFLDKPKPKHYTIVLELLINANSAR